MNRRKFIELMTAASGVSIAPLIAGCGGGNASSSPSSVVVPPPPPPPVTQNIFPIADLGPIRGVNTQAVFRTRLNRELRTEQEVIDKVANAVTSLGFNSIRLGGTSSFGGTFDEAFKGFGWAKYLNNQIVRDVHGDTDIYEFEPYNFNVMAIKVAAQIGASIWIDFNTLTQEEEIDRALNLLEQYDVPLAGVTRDNEPYIGKRFPIIEESYETLADERYRDAAWPAMFIAPDGQSSDRENRQNKTAELIDLRRTDDTPIELHIYYPHEDTDQRPRDYFIETLDRTETRFGTNNFMIGEWSTKNEHLADNATTRQVISDYLEVLEARNIPSYFQILGTEYDEVGAWNMVRNCPNIARGADIIAERWAAQPLSMSCAL